jgi:hypothetical protein
MLFISIVKIYLLSLIVYLMFVSIPLRVLRSNPHLFNVDLPLKIAETDIIRVFRIEALCVIIYLGNWLVFSLSHQAGLYELVVFILFSISGLALLFGAASSVSNVIVAGLLIRRKSGEN